jgi:peroxiredoxin
MYDSAEPTYEKTTLVRVGDIAPDFAVSMLDGSTVTLSSLKGKAVLLVFFGSWCPDCQKQLAALEAFKASKVGEMIDILAISRGEKKSDVRDYISEYNFTIPVGIDADASIYSLYAEQYVPRCFVIDPLGRIVALSVGYEKQEFEVLCSIINSLL